MQPRRKKRQHGLTLMELIIVMVILVALAGILLPLFPSMLTRAHTSTGATNLAELSKAVQMYYSQQLKLPNNLDNLAPLAGVPNPTNAAVTSLIPAYPGGSSTTPDLFIQSLATADFNMLVSAGITTVLQTTVPTASGVGAWSPTFNPYSTTSIGQTFLPQNLTTATTPGASTALSSSLNVVYVSPTAVARELGSYVPSATTGTPVYVMFGVGDYSALTGSVLQTAPVHFDDSPVGEPNVAYGRYGLVFQTTADGTYTDLPTARFVGAVDLGDSSGITSIQDHMQEYLNAK